MIAKFVLAAATICDPALTAIFTPAHPRLGRYEVCVTAESLSERLGASAAEGVNYGTVEHLEVQDAFAATGAYDRPRLTRLYNGRRLEVVRGWRRDGHGFESITLLSPYPDKNLARLMPGTMIIRWIAPPG